MSGGGRLGPKIGRQQLIFLSSCDHQGGSKATRDNRLNKALRVLDLIAPRKSTSVSHETHLRLIQEFMQTDPVQFSKQQVLRDFSYSNPIQKSCLSNNEDPISHLLRLRREGWGIDATVLSHAVSSCFFTQSLRFAVQVHCLGLRTGVVFNVYVGSSLVSLYGKCGRLEDAYRVFEEMPVRNVVSWTAIISGFAQEWQVDVCLELYSRMRSSTLQPNDFTFTSLLSACTGSGSLGQGRSAHCQIIQMGFNSYTHIANALISMYCKCGDVIDAFYVFKKVLRKDVVSWNSMIAGCAQHGLAMEAIDLFEEMNRHRVKPDAISFLGVLSSCRHACLVTHCWRYFNLMVKHGLKPELDHYSCVVDLLGRAGFLKEAQDFVEKMPIYPNAIIWGSLLSSCRVHGNVWIGIQAAENRLLLEPGCASTHVQLANLYASVGFWDQAARVRKLMKDKQLKTNPGCSWIEVKSVVYRFRAEGRSSYKMNEVIAVLDSLFYHMRKLGYVPEAQMEEVDEDFI